MRHVPPPRRRSVASTQNALLHAAVLAAIAASAPAQRQFAELKKRGLPPDEDHTLAVAAVDVDGDGDLDLVFGNDGYGLVGRQNRVYRNDGGVFVDVTAAALDAATDLTFAVAAGDVDGDGDADLVFGDSPQSRLYLNDGLGAFTDGTAGRMPIESTWTRALALGDVDGDGDLDLVVANHAYGIGAQNALYLNNGSGYFTDATAARLPAIANETMAVWLGDVDGDSDPDLVVGNRSGGSTVSAQNRVYRNNGAGFFTDVTQVAMPADSDDTHAVAAADFDGDGDVDLVFGNHGPNRLHANDGAGVFTDVTMSSVPVGSECTDCVVPGDFDGDGDVDLFVGNGRCSEQDRLWINDGSGTFVDATAASLPVAGWASWCRGNLFTAQHRVVVP